MGYGFSLIGEVTMDLRPFHMTQSRRRADLFFFRKNSE